MTLESFIIAQSTYLSMISANVLIVFVAFLKHLRFNRRVRLLLRTLHHAALDLWHFLMVLFLTFMGFVLMAQVLLGYMKVHGWTSFQGAQGFEL